MSKSYGRRIFWSNKAYKRKESKENVQHHFLTSYIWKAYLIFQMFSIFFVKAQIENYIKLLVDVVA